MKKMNIVKWVLAVLVALFVGIQFVPVNRINPPVESDMQCPVEVKAILRVSCYDCHSHETIWPWYSRVAPVSWLIASDAKEGRHKLNFSAWNRYSPEKQSVLISDMIEQIKEGEMPPTPYTWMHKDSELTPEKMKILQTWADLNKK
jgi:hypothetical protein